ncbi:uncharacterized protein LOC117779602 [Drosophila innubila]|uniref:uncharacterized protein LOC117779602 n=1 Tax=Drosophila innubila TaxID=198719 RepID=UPI00148D0D60|nr:uncharacterized protein LOC117779602 [Drosophila innubila]
MANKYKLTESDLEISWDLDFIDKLLKCYDIEVESDTRRYLLDLSYTLARNQLVEARRFANLSNKTCIDVEDIKISQMEKTEDFQLGTLQLTKPIVQHLTTPSVTTSLLLPPWRNCQVGANAELKQLLVESDANKCTNNGATPNKLPRLSQRCPKSNF